MLSALIEPDDLIRIHDYHLIPLADELRALGAQQRIGFFLHIPFPAPEIFMAVPGHAWLAAALFAHDLIGFQTTADTANFIRFAPNMRVRFQIGEDRLRWATPKRRCAPSRSASTPLPCLKARIRAKPKRTLPLAAAQHGEPVRDRRRSPGLHQGAARPDERPSTVF